MTRIQVVAGQLEVDWNPARNGSRVVSFLEAEASPGSLVILPEGALSGYDDELSGLAQLDGRALACAAAQVAAAAVERGVHVVCGSLLREQDAWYNAALYFGPAGERWVYRKVNLATRERGRLAAGAALPVLTLSTTVGSRSGVAPAPRVSVGVQLCRELKYPEQWHVLARRGANVLAYLTCAANPKIAAGVWRSHLISRAAETERFVVAANVAHGAQHCPSVIITPRGEVVAESTGGSAQALHAELDLTEVSDWVLSQQRCDVVAVSYAGSGGGP